MLYKGCIVKVEKDFAIILTDKMEYLKIVKRDGLTVGKEILFLEEDLYGKKNFSYRKVAIVAAIFLIMIISMPLLNKTQGNNISYGATAIISIDINPSLELQINKENKVIKMVSLNQDAKKLLINEKLVGKPIEDAVLIVINKAKENKYLDEEKKSVLIATVMLENTKNEDIKSRIEKKLDEDENLQNIDSYYIEGTKEDLQYAREEKVSIGKYEAFQEMKEKNKKVNLENIKNMKVQEMVEKNPSVLMKKEEKRIKKQKQLEMKSETEEKIEIEKKDDEKPIEIKNENQDKIKKEKEDKIKELNKGVEKKEKYIPLKNEIKDEKKDKEKENEEQEKDNDKQEKDKEKAMKKKNKE